VGVGFAGGGAGWVCGDGTEGDRWPVVWWAFGDIFIGWGWDESEPRRGGRREVGGKWGPHGSGQVGCMRQAVQPTWSGHMDTVSRVHRVSVSQ
jgi:hypothetical protein